MAVRCYCIAVWINIYAIFINWRAIYTCNSRVLLIIITLVAMWTSNPILFWIFGAIIINVINNKWVLYTYTHIQFRTAFKPTRLATITIFTFHFAHLPHPSSSSSLLKTFSCDGHPDNIRQSSK